LLLAVRPIPYSDEGRPAPVLALEDGAFAFAASGHLSLCKVECKLQPASI